MRYDIVLNSEEIMQGALAGAMRQTRRLKENRPGRRNQPIEQQWHDQCEGALGEMALAKHLRIFWSSGSKGLPDLGGNIEVKTTRHQHGRLLLYGDEPDNRICVLVTGIHGKYNIRGWLYAKQIKQERYWFYPKPNRPCHGAPQEDLYSVSELLDTDLELKYTKLATECDSQAALEF